MSPFTSAVLRTLAWFDMFGYPLTLLECWRYLYIPHGGEDAFSPVTPWQVQELLEQLRQQGAVEVDLGHWRLSGSGATTAARLAGARIAIGKQHRAMAGARWLRYIPFVRFVGLGNTLALGVARAGGDIDLLIVLRRGRLFLGRLIITAVLHLRRWRRHHGRVHNRLCLSFYLDDQHLNLAPLAYREDVYLTYWAATLVPLTGAATYGEFVASNFWVSEALPNWSSAGARAVCTPLPDQPAWSARVLEVILDVLVGWWAEPLARALQLRHMKRRRGSRLGDGTTAVVVSDGVLKFHESDRRLELAAAYRQRLAGLGIAVV